MAIVKFSIGFAWPGCRTASGAVGRGGTRKCELGVKLRTGCKRRGWVARVQLADLYFFCTNKSYVFYAQCKVQTVSRTSGRVTWPPMSWWNLPACSSEHGPEELYDVSYSRERAFRDLSGRALECFSGNLSSLVPACPTTCQHVVYVGICLCVSVCLAVCPVVGDVCMYIPGVVSPSLTQLAWAWACLQCGHESAPPPQCTKYLLKLPVQLNLTLAVHLSLSPSLSLCLHHEILNLSSNAQWLEIKWIFKTSRKPARGLWMMGHKWASPNSSPPPYHHHCYFSRSWVTRTRSRRQWDSGGTTILKITSSAQWNEMHFKVQEAKRLNSWDTNKHILLHPLPIIIVVVIIIIIAVFSEEEVFG